LWTAGSVGSQALLGIPVVAALREGAALRDVSLVWPFETGFSLDPVKIGTPAIVHAEIWPGIVRVDPGHGIKDAVQVRSLATHFFDLDVRGELERLFAAPDRLASEALRDVVNEEGWILGA
jgi:precorrin-8X/cobalt-precorrin-8 methylmutase